MSATQPERDESARVARERRTVRCMVEMYCRDEHLGQTELCPECADLYSYAMARLDRCIYHSDKPTCKNCPVHCYRSDKRAMMREVMVHSGPRMLFRHPVLAIRHLLDDRKPASERPARDRA